MGKNMSADRPSQFLKLMPNKSLALAQSLMELAIFNGNPNLGYKTNFIG